MRIAIITAEFNYDVTSRMYAVAKEKAAALNLEGGALCLGAWLI